MKVKISKKLLTLITLLILSLVAIANDQEIVEFLDFFENYELVEDENYDNLAGDENILDNIEEKSSPEEPQEDSNDE